ncbi:ATP-binding protein [Polaromonas sp.]|uniref:sensor histidine kinase n=1 Tax=Polaromonas sp. TaxID=1869339 RepID=UPI003751E3F2
MAAGLLYYDYQRARDQLVRDSLSSARALMLAVDREFEGVERSLRALSTSPSLKRMDLPALHDQAMQVLDGHYINNIVLIDAAGQQRLNTARPYGEVLPGATNLFQLERVLGGSGVDISDIFLAPLPARLAINVAVPVYQGTKVTHSLAGVVVPEHLQKILVDRNFSPDRVVAILDASGHIVARSREIRRFIGQSATPILVKRLQEVNEDILEAVTREGIPVLTVFAKSPSSRWAVAIGIPIDSLSADLRRSLGLLAGFSVLLLAASLGMAWWMGDRIARSIQALRAPAQALGYGQKVDVPALPIREVDELGRAISKASTILAAAEEALTSSEARMRGVVESAMDAIITVDEAQRIVLYNKAAERIFGWSHAEVLGERLEKLIPERFRVQYASPMTHFSAADDTSGGMGDGTLVYGLRASGQEFPMEASVSQLETTDGKLFSVILRDVTVRLRDQQALERSNLDLQQFAYIASHDLKTPLRSIGGFVQILEKEYGDKLDERARGLIGRTAAAARRLESLTEDLLSYARVNSEVRPFARVKLREVADEVVLLLDAAIQASGAQVNVGELPDVMGDRTQLAQLLMNLVGNGMKYCKGRAPLVHISATRDEEMWLLSVADNGIGIDSKQHEKVFEVFTRLHSQQEYPGTGIGLAVCRRVVERHGGKIWITSVLGEGSTFHFTLPVTPESGQP